MDDGGSLRKRGPSSLSPEHEVLHDLYVVQGMSLRTIGLRYGVAPASVGRWLRTAGIQARKFAGREGQTYVPTEEHRRKLRDNAAKAREKVTEEGRSRAAAKRKGSTPWNKGKPASEETRAKLKAVRSTIEYRKAQSERQRRGDNPRARASPRSDLLLHGWEWRERRQECYARDNWTCQDCGVKCLGGKDARRYPPRRIQAHHIVRRRDGGLDDLSNLVTLCVSCHTGREQKFKRALFA